MPLMSVNLGRISTDPKICAIVRLTAMQCMENPYLSVGDFFKNVSDIDLDVIQGLISLGLYNNDDVAMQEVLTLILMLTQAEGSIGMLEADSNESQDIIFNKLFTAFQVMTTCTISGRRGDAKVFFENFSFDDSMIDAKIIEMIDPANPDV